MSERTLGLLLQSIPYLGSHRILKVLTPTHGLISILAKFAASKKGNWSALTTPFLIAEWVYTQGRSDLCLLKEGSLIDPLFPLKDSYRRIEAAGQIAQDLLRTQLPGKAAEGPFSIAITHLRELAAGKEEMETISSFRRQLLEWEGLWDEGDEGVSSKKINELFEQQLGR
jgi:DNA repair protein RecO